MLHFALEFSSASRPEAIAMSPNFTPVISAQAGNSVAAELAKRAFKFLA